MGEHAIFRNFMGLLALGGAVAEWTLACWIAAPLGVHLPLAVHLLAPLGLAIVNRLAARSLEREPAHGILTGTGGRLALAGAFGALACLAALTVVAGGWATLRLMGALQVEAGVVAAGAGVPLFGRDFRWFGSIVMALTAVVVAYGYVRGHRRLVVTRLTVPIPGLPAALAGLRLVQVSDFHLGPLADRDALRDALAQVAALAPDVICLTGDVVDSPATNFAAWLPELATLRAPHGVFAILGNHDRHVGLDRVAAALAQWTDFRLLRDEVATITVGDARLHVVGLEDRPGDATQATLPAVLARVPADEPFVLLAHHPGIFPAAVAAGVPLMLAGHTHGGQVAVPGLPALNPARLLMTRFDAGTYRRAGAVLHVNRGLGTSGQRLRVGAPREITVVTLVAAAARAA